MRQIGLDICQVSSDLRSLTQLGQLLGADGVLGCKVQCSPWQAFRRRRFVGTLSFAGRTSGGFVRFEAIERATENTINKWLSQIKWTHRTATNSPIVVTSRTFVFARLCVTFQARHSRSIVRSQCARQVCRTLRNKQIQMGCRCVHKSTCYQTMCSRCVNACILAGWSRLQ